MWPVVLLCRVLIQSGLLASPLSAEADEVVGPSDSLAGANDDEYYYEYYYSESEGESDLAAVMLGSEAWLSAGIRYDRNLSLNPDRIGLRSSPLFGADLYGYDQRVLLGTELRSIGYVDIDIDLLDSEQDFQAVTVQVGPVFHLGDSWDLYASVGGEFSFFGYEFYTGLGAGYLSLENLGWGPLRSVNLDVGFERTGEAFGGGDAPWVDFYATFGVFSSLFKGDWIEFTPLIEVYHSDQTLYRYGQLEATLGYGIALAESLELASYLTAFRRSYYGSDQGGSSRRRDWFLLAELGFVYSGLFVDALAVEVQGSYQQNWSNFTEESYDGGSVGVVLHWRFLSLDARTSTPSRPGRRPTRRLPGGPGAW